MTFQHQTESAPRWAWWTCSVLVCCSFLMYVFFLDRYPGPYVDEPAYNLPAVRYLQGKGFTYHLSDQAPHRELNFWGFYSRMQVATFTFFGVSYFTCRIPQFLSAHLALLVLCFFLLAQGLHRPALFLAVAWFGDRSIQEILYGRMEGISLLMLVVGFIFLHRTRDSGGVPCFLAGLFLGMATGFHLSNLFFAFGGILFTLRFQRVRGGALFIIGCGLPALLWFIQWWPHPSKYFELFRWYLSASRGSGDIKPTLLGKWVQLFQVLQLSRYWVLMLVLFAVPMVFSSFWGLSKAGGMPRSSSRDSICQTACFFVTLSVSGLVISVGASIYPYYLVCFSMWPMLVLSLVTEVWRKRSLGPTRTAVCVAFILLVSSWLPSLAWNLTRFREAVVLFSRLDSSDFVRALKETVPSGVHVQIEPNLFIYATRAKLDYSPVAWFDEPIVPDARDWLLLTPQALSRVGSNEILKRSVIRRGEVFPLAKSFPYILLGPREN